jgi:hypothetical protein
MSVVLVIVGALAFVAGLAMVGFGIPIKEFSFGNTLIAAGAPVAVGGLIIIGLGAVVSKLRQLNETLNAHVPLAAAPDMLEATIPPRTIPPAADLSFPRRPRATEPERPLPPRASEASGPVPEKPFGDAPVLPNPDLAPAPTGDIAGAKEKQDTAGATEKEKAPPLAPPPRPTAPMPPLRPMAPMPPPPAGTAERGTPLRPPPPKDLPGPLGPPPVEPRQEQADRPAWLAPSPTEPPQEREFSQPSRFDAMWPADEAKPVKPAFGADRNAEHERPPRENVRPAEAEPEMLPPGGEQLRAVAILKSGVVDGMGYTLYVDGSIEAELPQGTLRFASITELRGYLQNNA